jgi:IS30 family transposase
MAQKKRAHPRTVKRHTHLTVFERSLIGQKHREGVHVEEIARIVKRERSTVIRELAQNGTPKTKRYRPESADRLKSINERVSGIVLLGKMKDGTIAESNRVVIERMSAFPPALCKTLTRDRGAENLGYSEIEKELDMTCYFAHAYCSQERGSNENLNGLVRRVYPKKTDFRNVTESDLRALEHRLNTRPRKRHGGKTPLEVLYERTGCALQY